MQGKGKANKGNVQLKTSGHIRDYLAEAIIKVGSGEMGLDEANRITKLVAQVHESFYSEIKILKTQFEMGEKREKLGNLSLGPTPQG